VRTIHFEDVAGEKQWITGVFASDSGLVSVANGEILFMCLSPLNAALLGKMLIESAEHAADISRAAVGALEKAR